MDWPWDLHMDEVSRSGDPPFRSPCRPPRSPFEAARACGCPEATITPRSPFEALRGLGLPHPARPTCSPFAAACQLAERTPTAMHRRRWPLYLACALLLHGAVVASGLLLTGADQPPEPLVCVMEISLGTLAVPGAAACPPAPAPEASPQVPPQAKPETKPAKPPEREKAISAKTAPTAAPAPEAEASPAPPAAESASAAVSESAPVHAAPVRRPGADGAYGQEDVDRKPSALSAARPVYPLKARKKNITGKVVVRFLVRPDGQVERIRVVSADPEGVFEESVLAAVQTWRFAPGQVDGRAVPTWVQAPVVFSLSD